MRIDGATPPAPEGARLDWGVQTAVLRRLCAGRETSLELMRLVALGYDDDELRSALGFDDARFDAEVNAIQADFEQLSRAFFAHDALKRRPRPAAAALTPAAEEALEIIGEALRPAGRPSPAEVIDELRAASFLELVEKISGDLQPFLSGLSKLSKSRNRA